ncbi:MAG: NAD-dependent epimerase/dehydratase family protein [Anaerolineae bacterium]|nr:NAD-dependent epimerase/dehydratase family protein [Anaerolineae bacterium]
MQALVTGATGCVGANVVAALLERGYQVRAMHRATSRLDALAGLEVESVVADVLDPPSLVPAMQGCRLVFHVAAVSDYWRTAADAIYRVNVDGTRNVVDAALQAGVERLVLTSSVAALGIPSPGQLLDERATFNLPPHRFHYGYSKHLAEQVLREGREKGLDGVIVNPTGVIGPRDVHWISGSLLREVQNGWAWFAPAGGISWASAVDVGLGHVLAAERGRSGERYVLGGENLSHREALEVVSGLVGGRRPLFTIPFSLTNLFVGSVRVLRRVIPIPISPEQVWLSAREIYCDSGKAARELAYLQAPFGAAVEQAYRWYQERGWLQ